MFDDKNKSRQLVCFSHLPWNFVYQRPQHLIRRFTNKYEVYYIEEFVKSPNEDGYSIHLTDDNATVIAPHLNNQSTLDETQRKKVILKSIFTDCSIHSYIFWYYTPMAVAYTSHFNPMAIVYDCMDELSAFKFAPQQLKTLEQDLFNIADIVFTGGNHLYNAKKSQHTNIHSFPSSIDKAHFKIARSYKEEPEDQANISHPRLGFYGVIDERFDIDLLLHASNAKPDWQFILVGPVIKIDPAILPKNKNIHYLGPKTYDELPLYLSGWDIALIPFAINESTRFISPTKTPEYLAGGKPVISTPITDVVHPYQDLGLVHIVQNAEELIAASTLELSSTDKRIWLSKVDEYLDTISWDHTWQRMNELLEKVLMNKHSFIGSKFNEYV
jgi:glycosyltransferase involved in cell wall biosynthesis